MGSGDQYFSVNISRGQTMVKQSSRMITGAHYGLRDWLVQRVTAVLMAAYILLLAGIVFVVAPQDYASWVAVFNRG